MVIAAVDMADAVYRGRPLRAKAGQHQRGAAAQVPRGDGGPGEARYAADNGIAASLTAASPNGSITCTNTKTNDYWLNGFSAVVRNVFGRAGDGE